MLSELKRKKKHLGALLKVRKAKLEQEVLILMNLKNEASRLTKKLNDDQLGYLQAVEKLNQARITQEMIVLAAYDKGIDRCKEEWLTTLKKLREAENAIKSQNNKLKQAQMDLKAVEGLQEKTDQEYTKELARLEQAISDDLVNQKYVKQVR